MMIEKNGIEIVCENDSYMFEGEQSRLYISAEKLISAPLGASYCPRTNIVRGLNCEMLVITEKWNEQILLTYINFGSDDTPEVNFYGNNTKFIKLYLEAEGEKWYIARYELFDGEGNYIEEQEFYIEEKEF
ncbi:MAG: hypothetical protein ACP5JT_06155 [Thermoplasmata archaeon]